MEGFEDDLGGRVGVEGSWEECGTLPPTSEYSTAPLSVRLSGACILESVNPNSAYISGGW